MKTYKELTLIETFQGRLDYLSVNGNVADVTFGPDRWVNQKFYRSRQWRDVRDFVISRDNGYDLAFYGCVIPDKIIVHHMNPISVDDITNFNPDIVNPEYLVCVSKETHDAIHYGRVINIDNQLIARRPGDTKLW